MCPRVTEGDPPDSAALGGPGALVPDRLAPHRRPHSGAKVGPRAPRSGARRSDTWGKETLNLASNAGSGPPSDPGQASNFLNFFFLSRKIAPTVTLPLTSRTARGCGVFQTRVPSPAPLLTGRGSFARLCRPRSRPQNGSRTLQSLSVVMGQVTLRGRKRGRVFLGKRVPSGKCPLFPLRKEGLHLGDRKGGVRGRGSSQTKGELVSGGRWTASHPGQEQGRPPTGGVGRSSRLPGPHPEHGPALSLLHDFLPLLLPGTLGIRSVLRVRMRFKETHPLARDHAARKPQRWDSAPGPCDYKGPPSTCVGFAATGNRLRWISHGWQGSREGLEVIGCGVG